jgi:hypothetical protein
MVRSTACAATVCRSAAVGEVTRVRLADAVPLGGDRHVDRDHRPAVGGDQAVLVGDQHALVAIHPADGDLLHRGVCGARELLDAGDQRQLAVDADLGPRHLHAVVGRAIGLELEVRRRRQGRALRDRRRGAGRGPHRVLREILGEGEADLVADHGAQADALLDAGRGQADDAVLEA